MTDASSRAVPQLLTELEAAEYAALRATIRERGTSRFILLWASLAAWAALGLGTLVSLEMPAAALIPLLALAAGYEAVHALSVNVERIGRYVHARYEVRHAEPLWERATLEFGRMFPGTVPDPLGGVLFGAATVLNFFPVALSAYAAELVAVGAAHTALLARIVLTRRAARRQRADDLARFRDVLAKLDDVPLGTRD